MKKEIKLSIVMYIIISILVTVVSMFAIPQFINKVSSYLYVKKSKKPTNLYDNDIGPEIVRKKL